MTRGAYGALPFGLGSFALVPINGSIRSTRVLGDETMVLEMSRTGPPPYRREEVTIASGGVLLAGTLLIAEGSGPRPGIVLVHGSGAGDRTHWEYRSWADFYARRGIAALVYDRRGEGDSLGNAGLLACVKNLSRIGG